jgi:hypothetical protein
MEQVNGWTLTVFCGQVDDFILCRELGEPCWCCMYSAKKKLPVSLLVNHNYYDLDGCNNRNTKS